MVAGRIPISKRALGLRITGEKRERMSNSLGGYRNDLPLIDELANRVIFIKLRDYRVSLIETGVSREDRERTGKGSYWYCLRLT